ncbi:hypothetical protein [Eubacterium oxidoreducens]|nr:hypothetical protein [Eubacterium oxidoreducens]
MNKLDDLAKKNAYVLEDSTTDDRINQRFDNEEQATEKLAKVCESMDDFDNFYINYGYPVEQEIGYGGSDIFVMTANQNLMSLYNNRCNKRS